MRADERELVIKTKAMIEQYRKKYVRDEPYDKFMERLTKEANSQKAHDKD